MARLMYTLGCLLFSLPLYAGLTTSLGSSASDNSEVAKDVANNVGQSPLSLLEDLPTKNQIPLFNNRFRVDENAEEITLLLFRKPGSSSVVLVKPDGSKINYYSAKEQGVLWHDDKNYDLVQIKNPMPGPWQAIGKVLPESRIMLLSDIKLHVDSLPTDLMVGETVKVAARLTNKDMPMTAKNVSEVLSLEVIFISTNNPDYENFGRGVVQVAQFRDDGKGFDERARDGVFTGEFQLRYAPGEWIPKYVVRTPLYVRELELPAFVLKPSPIAVDISTAKPLADGSQNQAASHQVLFKTVDASVKAESILLQGRTRFPTGEVESFVLNEAGKQVQELLLPNKGYGSYILEVSAYGEHKDGREFMLNLPETSFVVARAIQEAPVLSALPLDAQPELAITDESKTEDENSFPWFFVIVANVFIISCGVFSIWFVMNDKKMADLAFWRKSQEGSKKLQNGNRNTADKNKKNEQKNNEEGEILDLSLPDD